MTETTGGRVVALRFRDGVERRIQVAPEETVLAAALRDGVALVHQCESGSCGTCIGRLVEGETTNLPGRTLALLRGEIRDGMRLLCCSLAASDATFELDYPSTLAEEPGPRSHTASVTGLDWVSRSVARLDLALSPDSDLTFVSGQYVRIRVPGTDAWRSYSMASPSKELPTLRFLVRYLEGGVLSEWLRAGCAPGVEIEIEGPMGSFRLAEPAGRQIMVAGGTGLAPILAMLDSLREAPGPPPPVLLCFGCNTVDDLFYADELELRAFWMPKLTARLAVMEAPDGDFPGSVGTAVSLIEDADLADGDLTAYLCGPPVMVEAARTRLIDGGVPAERILCEQFRPTAA